MLALAATVVVFEFTFNGSFVGSDDAYIHLRYIDNLRSGHGFGFNPDRPSNGSTSPLWVLIAAGITQGKPNLPQTVKSISVLLFAISLFVFYALFFRLTSSVSSAAAATCIYVSDPWLLKWAGSVMEASLASLLVLLAAFFIIRLDRTQDLILASLVLGLATLVRPEIILLFLFFLLLSATIKNTPLTVTRRIAIALATYSSILVPWLLFAFATFGSPIPNTFFAKTLASEATIWQVAWYFLRVIGVSYWWVWLVGLISLTLFLIRSAKNHTASLTGIQNRTVILLWLWCIAIPAFYSFSKLQTPSTRYLQITTPILIAIGFYGLIQLAIHLRNWETHHLHLLLITVAAGIVVYQTTLNMLIVLPSSYDFSEGVLQTYRDVGEWLGDNTSESSRIAVAIDVGTIGYYSNREIIDLGGLNTPEAISYLPDSLSYVFVSRPEYLVMTGEERQYKLADQTRFKGIATPVFSLPMNIGLRADVDQATGGREKKGQYVTVYRLSWP